ncbi:MAG: divalent-cation tolerance protein CutA [Burkholderiaceae bacterium]|jgi:periplasmic divalent cation tolerance protein|nr:divalent-cation tolerance protein CutA [Burkholderiaceae bacterium]
MNPFDDPDAPCLVLTSTATEAQAESLAAAIVKAHLAACVQMHPVRSVYCWEGALQRESEWALNIKTRNARFAALEAFIRAHHPYQTPEVLRLPIDGGSADYLRWLDAQTR